MNHDQDSGAVSRRRAVTLGSAAAIGALVLTRGVHAQEATPQATPSDCAPTTPDENKTIVQQFYAAWVTHDETALAGLLAPGYVHHWGFSTDTNGADAMIERLGALLKAFPDFAVEVDMILAENDLVAAHWIATGTQTGGEFQGVPPTTVSTTWTGLNIFRISCGLIVEGWNESDHLGRLIQAGIITDEELGSVGTPTP